MPTYLFQLAGACYLFIVYVEYVFNMAVSDIISLFADVKPQLSIFQAVIKYVNSW